VCIRVSEWVYVCVFVCVVCVHTWVSVCVYVCVCVFLGVRQRMRETGCYKMGVCQSLLSPVAISPASLLGAEPPLGREEIPWFSKLCIPVASVSFYVFIIRYRFCESGIHCKSVCSVCVCVCAHKWMSVCVYKSEYMCVCTWVSVCTWVCVWCVHMSVCVCMCVFSPIWIHVEAIRFCLLNHFPTFIYLFLWDEVPSVNLKLTPFKNNLFFWDYSLIT